MESLRAIKIPVIIFFICLCGESRAKLNVSKADQSGEVKFPRKVGKKLFSCLIYQKRNILYVILIFQIFNINIGNIKKKTK